MIITTKEGKVLCFKRGDLVTDDFTFYTKPVKKNGPFPRLRFFINGSYDVTLVFRTAVCNSCIAEIKDSLNNDFGNGLFSRFFGPKWATAHTENGTQLMARINADEFSHPRNRPLLLELVQKHVDNCQRTRRA